MRLFIFIISLFIHLIILNLHISEKSDPKEVVKDNISNKLEIRLNKQIVQTEKVENEKSKNKEFFLGKENQSVQKNINAKKRGSFKEGSNNKKKISFKDLSIQKKKVLKNDNEESTSPDYMPNTDVGDVVEFNTIRYKYHSFFARIKNRLANNWRPAFMVTTSLVTTLSVKIDNEGHLLDVRLRKSSGNEKMDNSAIEAFKKAQPFLNPPKDLIAKGYFTFEWKFIVE